MAISDFSQTFLVRTFLILDIIFLGHFDCGQFSFRINQLIIQSARLGGTTMMISMKTLGLDKYFDRENRRIGGGTRLMRCQSRWRTSGAQTAADDCPNPRFVGLYSFDNALHVPLSFLVICMCCCHMFRHIKSTSNLIILFEFLLFCLRRFGN